MASNHAIYLRNHAIYLRILTNAEMIKSVEYDVVDHDGNEILSAQPLGGELYYEIDGDIYIYSADIFVLFPDVAVIVGLNPLYFDGGDSLFHLGHTLFYDNDAVTSYFGIEATPPSSPIQSLNGNGCEFMDGSKVNVNGRSQVYTVEFSFFFLLDDATYTPLYSLKSDTGATLYAPETQCTLYVPTVVDNTTVNVG